MTLGNANFYSLAVVYSYCITGLPTICLHNPIRLKQMTITYRIYGFFGICDSFSYNFKNKNNQSNSPIPFIYTLKPANLQHLGGVFRLFSVKKFSRASHSCERSTNFSFILALTFILCYLLVGAYFLFCVIIIKKKNCYKNKFNFT